MLHKSQLNNFGITLPGLLTALAFAIVLTFSQVAIAQSDLQSIPTASLTTEGVIQIPTGDIQETYIIDVSHMHFSNREEMVAFFSEKSCDEFLMRAIPSQGKAVLSLRCGKHPDWTCSDWNTMLQAHCQETPLTQ